MGGVVPPYHGKHGRIALSGLARHCSSHGIDPEQVNDATFQAFLDHLTTDSLIKLPRKVQQKAAVVWNRLAASEKNWPKQLVTIPDNRRTFALPWTAFPPSLKADIDAYIDRLAGRDILAELDFRPLRPASMRTRRHEIQAYISALVHRGCDPRTFAPCATWWRSKSSRPACGSFSTARPTNQPPRPLRSLASSPVWRGIG